MQAAAPGLFTYEDSSQGLIQGLVMIAGTNEIAMPRTDRIPSRPAHLGENVTIYANGLGEVIDGVTTGTPAPLDRLISTKNQIRVVVGEVEIDPTFAGLAPGTTGSFQINAQLPHGVPVGPAIPLYIRVTLSDGTVVESNTVTLAVDGGESQ